MRLQQGYSLVEVLVALVIVKIGLLGILAGQTLALRNVIDATQRTQAVALASELINTSYSNQQLIPLMSGRLTSGDELAIPSLCSSDIPCNHTELAQWQRFNWYQQWANIATSPLVSPEFCLSAAGTEVSLFVSWQQRLASHEPMVETCALVAGRSGFTVGGAE